MNKKTRLWQEEKHFTIIPSIIVWHLKGALLIKKKVDGCEALPFLIGI